MGNKTLRLLFLITIFFSCDPKKVSTDYCEDAIYELSSQSFEGTIFLCNAQAPDMDFLKATATINSIYTNEISIHLKSDTSLIDTILKYKLDCKVVESTIPIVSIQNLLGNEVGHYNQGPDRISISFGFPNCLNNTHFEGYVE